MKRLIENVIIIIAAGALVYFLFSFIAWDLDARRWQWIGRWFFVLFWAAAAAASLIFMKVDE